MHPNVGGVPDGITISGGIGLGTGGRGSGEGGGGNVQDTGGGVLHIVVSVHRSSTDLGSGSSALAAAMAFGAASCARLMASGSAMSASSTASCEHVAVVSAMTMKYWAAP
jgi:hypothetical protein